jgi:hypothetical protein
MKRLLSGTPALFLVAVTGCATVGEPRAFSHTYESPDGMHMGFQLSMHTGLPNTPQQTIMVVYNKYQTTPIAMVNGQTKTFEEQLGADILQAATSLGTAAIAGGFAVQAARENVDCPHATICGTLVQVANQAGATAGAAAEASSM